MINDDTELLCAKEELCRLLDEGIQSMLQNNGRPAEEVFAEIEKRFGFNQRGQSD